MARRRAQSTTPPVTAEHITADINISARQENFPIAPTRSPVDAIGMLSEGQILLGLTDFLLDETQSALAERAVPIMYRTLCDSMPGADGQTRVGLGWLFVRTCSVMANTDSLNLATAPSTLFEAAVQDLRRLPASVTDRALFQATATRPPEIQKALLLGRLIIDFAGRIDRDPGAAAIALAALSDESAPPWCKQLPNACDAIAGELANIRRHATLFQQVLGVVQADQLADDAMWYAAVRAVIINAHLKENAIHAATLEELARGIHGLDAIRKHLTNAGRALHLLRGSSLTDSTPGSSTNGEAGQEDMGTGPSHADRAQLYVDFMKNVIAAFELAAGIDRRAAPGAQHVRIVEQIGDAIAAMSGRDYTRGMVAVVGLLQSLEMTKWLPTEGIRVLTFAADMGVAATSEEVTDALHAFASASSARAGKRARNSSWLVHLQGYGGVASGVETTNDLTPVAFGGAYFPVGVEVTFGGKFNLV